MLESRNWTHTIRFQILNSFFYRPTFVLLETRTFMRAYFLLSSLVWMKSIYFSSWGTVMAKDMANWETHTRRWFLRKNSEKSSMNKKIKCQRKAEITLFINGIPTFCFCGLHMKNNFHIKQVIYVPYFLLVIWTKKEMCLQKSTMNNY